MVPLNLETYLSLQGPIVVLAKVSRWQQSSMSRLINGPFDGRDVALSCINCNWAQYLQLTKCMLSFTNKKYPPQLIYYALKIKGTNSETIKYHVLSTNWH